MRNYDDYLELLDGADVGPLEADRRASRFLTACSFVSQDLQTAEMKTLLANDSHSTTKAELYLTVPESLSNQTLRDAHVQRQPARIQRYEVYAKYKGEEAHLKRLYEIFTEAHTYFRQKARVQ